MQVSFDKSMSFRYQNALDPHAAGKKETGKSVMDPEQNRNHRPARYIVVTPVRDEETYLPRVIQSMASQTVPPAEWILVNDGSKDRTGEIIAAAAAQYPWIRAVQRQDRGYRKWGAGIIEAFYAGFEESQCPDWEFMCKLDGDLSFELDYFESAIARFRALPELGIGGGMLYHYASGRKVIETHPMFHVRGGVKIYRRACWDCIGGLWVGPGSDTVDEVKANMLGWKTTSFPELQLEHHRPTGASWGRWGGLVKDGKIDYVYGSHPLFLAAKAIARLSRRPYVMGSIALVYGYLRAWMSKTPRVDDSRVIAYLRQQQLARLAGRPSIWK
jgi:glycosyltransferase involved in cell wall biosynthesis